MLLYINREWRKRIKENVTDVPKEAIDKTLDEIEKGMFAAGIEQFTTLGNSLTDEICYDMYNKGDVHEQTTKTS